MLEKNISKNNNVSKSKTFSPKKIFVFSFAVLFLSLAFFTYYFVIGSFNKFSQEKVVYIKKGMGLKEISDNLKKENVISSSLLLTSYLTFLGDENKVVSGPYLFSKTEGVISVGKRITSGDFKIKAIKITIPEGFTVADITDRISDKIEAFDSNTFKKQASKKEGYLFPETYFFMPDATAEDILDSFSNTFDDKISSIKKDIVSSGKDLNQIIIMASILEEEVRSPEDKKIVSGILWKRIQMKMPLQVDATLAYVIGKDSLSLTMDDLKKDSPYNTYTRLGLPPTAISNPGLDSIEAAANPKKTDYLYFLTDKQGNVHYAKTFEEHVQNKKKYLK